MPISRAETVRWLRSKGRPLQAAITVMLYWLMVVDGRAAREERAVIDKLDNELTEQDEKTIARIVEAPPDLGLTVCAQTIQESLAAKDRERLTELAVMVMVADGYLTPGERLVVEFIADLCRVSPDGLNAIYAKLTGQDLSERADPSDPHWWAQREEEARARERHREREEARNRERAREEQRYQGRERQSGAGVDAQRIKALAILGLVEGATLQEIKQAYRRLAQVHHPDRFESLGDGATQAANATFQRIQWAYAELTQ